MLTAPKPSHRSSLPTADAAAAAEFAELGLLGADQDRAADGVAAEQRALRPAQDLDARDIAEIDRAADAGPDRLRRDKCRRPDRPPPSDRPGQRRE